MMHDDKMLWVDVSHYQKDLDYRTLAAGGVKGLVARVGFRASADATYRRHIDGAREAGMRTAAYHWFDPTIKLSVQRDLLLRHIRPSEIDFLTCDVEQYWQDWREWYAARNGTGKITKFISPSVISNLARAMIETYAYYVHPVTVLYTSRSFVLSYAPAMTRWITANQTPLWLAQYPYSRTPVTTTWEELPIYYPILSGPRALTDNWMFWQFSGDKFRLPGVKGPIDLNFFNGTERQYEIWRKTGAVPVTLEPVQMRLRYRVLIRKEPRVGATILGRLEPGQVIDVLETKRIGEEVWRRHSLGWSASYWRSVQLMEAVAGE